MKRTHAIKSDITDQQHLDILNTYRVDRITLKKTASTDFAQANAIGKKRLLCRDWTLSKYVTFYLIA